MYSLIRFIRNGFVLGQHFLFVLYSLRCGLKIRLYKQFTFLLCNLRFSSFFEMKPLVLLNDILFKLMPMLLLRTIRFKRKRRVFFLPSFIISEHRRYQLSLQWFYSSVLRRVERSLELRIVEEVFDILQGQGNSIRKKQEEYVSCLEHRVRLRFVRGFGRRARRARVYISSYK